MVHMLGMSGNNYHKVKLLCSFIPLKIVAKGTFTTLQRKYIAPAIEEHWAEVQSLTHAKHKDSPVVAWDNRYYTWV